MAAEWVDLRNDCTLHRQKLKTGNWVFVLAGKEIPSGVAALGFRRIPAKPDLWVSARGRITLDDIKRYFPAARITQAGDAPLPSSASAVITARTLLGQNARGESVYLCSDGRRSIVVDGHESFETDRPSPRYLRANTATDLPACMVPLILRMFNGEFVQFDQLIEQGSLALPAGVPANSRYSERQLQEAFEAAMVRYGVRAVMSAENMDVPDRAMFDHVVSIYDHQPVFRARSSTQVELQQYSTPLPLALAASAIVPLKPGDRVYEPAVGHGSLLAGLPSDVMLMGSDLDADRLNRTRDTYPLGEFASVDASFNEPPQDLDLVITNPPFGGIQDASEAIRTSAKNYRGLRVSRIDHWITLKAMEGLKPGGRAVLILAGDSPLKKTSGELDSGSRRFFNWMQDHVRVHGVLEVSGAMYRRQGAGWPVRMVVVSIPGKNDAGPYPVVPDVVPVAASWDDVWDFSVKMRAQFSQNIEVSAEPTNEPDGASPITVDNDENAWQRAYVSASTLGKPTSMIPSHLEVATAEAMAHLEETVAQVDQFVSEAMLWSLQELESNLSPEQIDATALSISRLSSGHGMIEGDQTGIGKGRVLAAAVRHALLANRPVVFFTEKVGLFTDFWRDLVDIGALSGLEHRVNPLVVNSSGGNIYSQEGELLHKFDASRLKSEMENGLAEDTGIVFITYSQISSGASAKRFEFCMDIARNGLLILDEAHNAAGVNSIINGRMMALTTQARAVFYSSATFAKRAENLNLYHRAFPPNISPDDLSEVLEVGGEAALEALSLNLARDGAFIRREHNFSNLAMTVSAAPSPARTEYYRKMVDEFAAVLELMGYMTGDVQKVVAARNAELAEALASLPETDRKGRRLMAQSTNFGSRLYTISRQFYLALKTQQVIDDTIESIEQRGQKPVIAVEQTMEAAIRAAIRDSLGVGDSDDDLDDDEGGANIQSGAEAISLENDFREAIRLLVDRIGYYIEYDSYGQPRRVDITSDAYLSLRKKVLDRIAAMPGGLPLSPLDTFREALEAKGYSLGEISGRTIGIANGKVVQFQKGDVHRIARGFNGGELDVVLLSRSGNSGISLHASERFKDQRQRKLIEWQVNADVSIRVQTLGRVNRYGQVVSPEILSVSSWLPGENRDISVQNRKLRMLSAGTTGDRENPALNTNVVDVMNTIGNAAAIRLIRERIYLMRRMGLSDMVESLKDDEIPESLLGTAAVSRFTGRLHMLPIAMQEELWATLEMYFREAVDEAEAHGANPLKTDHLPWDNPVVVAETIYLAGDRSSSFGDDLAVREIEYTETRDPLRWDKVREMADTSSKRLETFDFAWATQNINEHAGKTIEDMCPIEHRDALSGILLGQIEGENGTQEKQFIALRKLNERLTKWRDCVREHLRPGALVTLSDDLFGDKVAVLVDVRPSDSPFMTQWRVRLAFPGKSQVTEMTASSFIGSHNGMFFRGDNGKAVTVWDDHSEVKALQESFTVHPAGAFQVRRLVLAGNLFEALRTKISGQMSVYRHPDGTRERVFVLPKGATLNMVMHREMVLPDVDTAVCWLAEGTGKTLSMVSLAPTATAASAPYFTKDRHGFWKLCVPGAKSTGGKFFLDRRLRDAVGGDFSGNRTRMVAEFYEDLLPHVLAEMYRLGARVYAPGSAREEINAIRDKTNIGTVLCNSPIC